MKKAMEIRVEHEVVVVVMLGWRRGGKRAMEKRIDGARVHA